ncbi:hypothetical protein F5B17DRAFT_175600 [Nemania serpens]|nr:hypothetical protein F5B17DRAFT_175600 [Nemania serpens]
MSLRGVLCRDVKGTKSVFLSTHTCSAQPPETFIFACQGFLPIALCVLLAKNRIDRGVGMAFGLREGRYVVLVETEISNTTPSHACSYPCAQSRGHQHQQQTRTSKKKPMLVRYYIVRYKTTYLYTYTSWNFCSFFEGVPPSAAALSFRIPPNNRGWPTLSSGSCQSQAPLVLVLLARQYRLYLMGRKGTRKYLKERERGIYIYIYISTKYFNKLPI